LGNVTFKLDAVGAHHSHGNPHDLNKMFARFVDEVKAAGHTVTAATMHHGGMEDLLTEDGPTRAGAYGALALAATTLALLFTLALPLPVYAADAPAKPPAKAAKDPAPAPINPFQYPAASGWFIGLGTEGGAGSATVPSATSAGINPNSITTTTIDAHLLVGYVWAVPSTAMFATVEARAGWQNFNGSAPGFSFSGPLAFEQRFTVGAPVDQIMALFPNILGNVTPPPFTPPLGQTIASTKWYLGMTLDERDISLNFGETANKAWAIAPGIVLGTKNLLSGGTLLDAYAKVRFDDKGFCAGSTLGVGCGSLGTSYLAGINLDWGI
jgi:hypothetical protein